MLLHPQYSDSTRVIAESWAASPSLCDTHRLFPLTLTLLNYGPIRALYPFALLSAFSFLLLMIGFNNEVRSTHFRDGGRELSMHEHI